MSLFGNKKELYKGEIKRESFNLPDIAAYFLFKKQEQSNHILSEQTYSDLGIEELYTFADRTVSRVGQQYLYHTLRNIPETNGEIEVNENIIKEIETTPGFRNRLTQSLSRIQDSEAYSIVKLLTVEHPVVSRNTSILFSILRFLPALFLLLYIWQHIAICGMLFLIAVFLNAGIHYVFKPKSLDYIYSIPQFIKLMKCAEELCKYPELNNQTKEIPKVLAILAPIKNAGLFLCIENKLQGEMAAIVWVFTELTHIFFLTEPISFVKSVHILKNKKREIEQVYQLIGLTDCLLSVYYLRNSLPYYCIPEQAESNYRIAASDMYHPLIQDCVANTILINEKSVLINGSNMSGKTTFIRIVGLNTVVAQTLHTVFARKFNILSPVYIPLIPQPYA